MPLDRRTFLKTGMAGFGSILLMPSCMRPQGPYQFFTSEEAACLMALCEQVIPADEWGGGAAEAGVIHYIDRQLVAVFHYHQVIYQRGIAATQATSLEESGKRFQALDFSKQNALLSRLERGELPGSLWQGVDQAEFFNLVIDHTMQGFYGSPRHGGNRNYMSYRMMDIDYPLVVGRNHYRHLEDYGK